MHISPIVASSLSILVLICCGERRAQVHVSRLSDPDRETRIQASGKLVEMGDAAVEPLIAGVAASGSDSLEYISAQILGRIGSRRAIPFLRQLAHRDNPFVRREAVTALGQTGDGGLVSLLADILQSDPDTEVRASAAKSLGSFRDTTAVQPLILSLQDTSAAVRRHALASLHFLWTADAERAAIGCLRDPDETVRFIAAQMMGTHRTGKARDALCKALLDTSLWVRTEAARSLGFLGDSTAVENLVALLRREGGPDHDAARQALRAITGMDYVLVE